MLVTCLYQGRADRYRDLCRCMAADIESDRAVQLCQLRVIQSELLQSADARLLILALAQCTDIKGIGLQRGGQRLVFQHRGMGQRQHGAV